MAPAMEMVLAIGAHHIIVLQALTRRNGTHEPTPGLEDAMHLVKRVASDALIQMFEDFRHDDSIEMAVGKCDILAVANLRAFADGVIGGLWRRVSDGRAIYLMIDGDIALTLGTILREELAVANDLLILDGIDLRDFDFVDLGRIRHPSNTVPVTIKSLVFATSGDPVNPAVAIA